MDVFAVFEDAAGQMERLKSAGHKPILVRMSELTADALADAILFDGAVGPMKKFMDLDVSIDNSYRYGIIRVLGEFR